MKNFRPPDQLLLPWSPKVTISMERAAEILDVSKQTIGRMIEDGTLLAYKVRPDKVNSPWRVNYESLMAHIEKMHQASGLVRRF